jgi:hypothetical protein
MDNFKETIIINGDDDTSESKVSCDDNDIQGVVPIISDSE